MTGIVVQALPTAKEMERLLESLANDEESAFRRALDLDVSHIDMRAQTCGVRITDVEIVADFIGVSYEIDYAVYKGCKDMDSDDSEEGFTRGVRTDQGWRFEEIVPLPNRSTLDDF